VCSLAKKLSAARGEALESARKWHLVGGPAAELFDHYRGSDSKSKDEKIAKKSCKDRVESADKLNCEAHVLAGIASATAVVFLALLFRSPAPKPTPQWRPEWKSKIMGSSVEETVHVTASSTTQDSEEINSVTTPVKSPSKAPYWLQNVTEAVIPFVKSPSAVLEKAASPMQPQASETHVASASEPNHPQSEPEEEVVVPKLNKRRSSISREISDDLPKTPRRTSSRHQIKVEPESASWSPLTVESLSKHTGPKPPSQMIGGLDVSSIVKTPRRRSSTSALNPSVKKTKSDRE